jgi:hypothetical protein
MSDGLIPHLERQCHEVLCRTPLASVKETDRRAAAEKLFHIGTRSAFELLADAATSLESRSKLVHDIACDQLRKGNSAECIESVCQQWFATRSTDLEQLIVSNGWTAQTPLRAYIASSLLTGSLQQLANINAEGVELLMQLLHDSNERLLAGATSVLMNLTCPEARERFCQLIVAGVGAGESSILRSIARTANYTPKDPLSQAQFFILTDQFDRLDRMGSDVLTRALCSEDFDVRYRLLARLRDRNDSKLNALAEACGNANAISRRAIDDEWARLQSYQNPSVSEVVLRKLLPKEIDGLSSSKSTATDQRELEALPEGSISVANLNCDIRIFAVGSQNGSHVQCRYIDVQRISDGSVQLQIPFNGDVYSIAISPDGNWLAVGSSAPEAVIHLWRLPNGEPTTKLDVFGLWVNCLAFDPSSQKLANGNGGVTVHVWDLKDFRLWRRFRANGDVQALVFNKTGDELVVQAREFNKPGDVLIIVDDKAQLWRLPEGTLLGEIDESRIHENSPSRSTEIDDAADIVGVLPHRVEVELQTTLRRHPALKKRSRGFIVQWNGLTGWSLAVDFPEAGRQEVSWKQITIVDPRVINNPLCKGLFLPGSQGSVRTLEEAERNLGRLLDCLQFLRLDRKDQERVLPGLLANPYAIQFLKHGFELDQLCASRQIGPETSAKVTVLVQLLDRIQDPKREAAYEQALKQAGLDLSVITQNSIRFIYPGFEEMSESVMETETNVESLLEQIDRKKLAVIDKQFEDVHGRSDWTLEELRTSADMENIRRLADECLKLLGVEPRMPNLVWITVVESSDQSSGVSMCGAFRTAYPELMLRLIKKT